MEHFPEILARGAVHYGFTGEVWTRSRVARVIQQTFGVQYTPRHVGRLLQQIQWTPQKPVTRATQRDEAAIARFSEERWEELEKKAEREGRTLVFIDETGFYLLPAAVASNVRAAGSNAALARAIKPGSSFGD